MESEIEKLSQTLSTAKGQGEFLYSKTITPLENKYNVSLEKGEAVKAIEAAMEENEDVSALREALGGISEDNEIQTAIDSIRTNEDALSALKDMFDSGELPSSLQAILDAVARMTQERDSGLGNNFSSTG